MAKMRLSIVPFVILWAGTAHGAVVHVPLKSSLVLKPGEAYTITVEATQPMELGWQAVQAKRLGGAKTLPVYIDTKRG